MDKLLDHYYQGKFGVPLSLPNRRFEPQTLKSKGHTIWAKFDDMPNGARRETLDCIRRQGILQITLFSRLNEPLDALHAKADEILAYYGVEETHALDDEYSLHVMSSYKAQGMPTDAWYMLPISINYHTT